MDWFKELLRTVGQYETLIWWTFAVSLALLLLTPAMAAWIMVRLPKDYFATKKRQRAKLFKRSSEFRPFLLVAKNALGLVLILAGLIMLVVPGQGLLTLAAGLMLVDFPGKFRLELWLATRPPVWRSINWLRKRAGREPLKRPDFSDGA